MWKALSYAATVGLIALVGMQLLSDSRPFQLLETALVHTWYKIHPLSNGDDRVVIVEVDDATLDSYGSRLGRDQLALLLEELASSRTGAAAIALDLYFEGEDRFDARNDTLLAVVLSRHRDRIINGLFLPVGREVVTATADSNHPALAALAYPLHDDRFPRVSGVALPMDLLLSNFGAVGHIDVWPDPDGVPNEIPMVLNLGNLAIPSLALESARQLLDSPKDAVTLKGGQLNLGSLRIPINKAGLARIPFSAHSDGYTRMSMLQALALLTSESVTKNPFRGKLILVGYNAPKLFPTENLVTPFGTRRSGVYLHADMISGILNQAVPRTLPFGVSLAAHVVVAGLFSLLIAFKGRILRVLIGILGIFGLVLVDFLLFRAGLLAPVIPALGLASILVVYTGIQAVHEQKAIIHNQGMVVADLRKKESSLALLEKELAVAKAVQTQLLPGANPTLAHYDIAGFNHSAREVGGDFYDFVTLSPTRLLITLGDVSGKGVPASLLMATCQAVVRSECQLQGKETCRLAGVVARLNDLIASTVEPGRFVTMFAAIVDAEMHTLEYCGAGHNPAIMISPGGEVSELVSQGVILGAFGGMSYTTSTVPMRPGDLLFVYSDGLVEASNAQDEEFGLERVITLGRDNLALPSEKLLGLFERTIRSFCADGQTQDDLTLIAVRRVD